jgi:hypothetical protein
VQLWRKRFTRTNREWNIRIAVVFAGIWFQRTRRCRRPSSLTGSGRPGIMQVLRFTDNPGGVKIQYKLLKGDPARSTNLPATQIGHFGPVMERVLPDPDNGSGKGNREALNLNTGNKFPSSTTCQKKVGVASGPWWRAKEICSRNTMILCPDVGRWSPPV